MIGGALLCKLFSDQFPFSMAKRTYLRFFWNSIMPRCLLFNILQLNHYSFTTAVVSYAALLILNPWNAKASLDCNDRQVEKTK